MHQLVQVVGRSPKQILRRLYSNYLGNPIPERTPLRAVADGMLRLDRESRILMLGQTPNFINHVIIVDSANERLVDVNPYLRVVWKHPRYEAILETGQTVVMEVRRELTIEAFVRESELYHTFARRIEGDQTGSRSLRVEEQASTRPTLRGVTARVRRETGCDIIELERGDGYFYWIYDDGGKRYETESVMVNSIGHMTMERWVADGVDFVRRMEEKGR